MMFYGRNKLIETLKANNLPYSRQTLNALEKAGAMPMNKHTLQINNTKSRFGTNTMRIYSEEEIDHIIKTIKALYDKKA